MIRTHCKTSSYSLFYCLHGRLITLGLLCTTYYEAMIIETHVAASSEMRQLLEETLVLHTVLQM